MIAALQMYDWPQVRARTDAFWAIVRTELRGAGIDAPSALTRPSDIHTPWTDPELVVGQTCGLPYMSGRAGKSVLVGRAGYDLPHAIDGEYASAVICHRDRAGELSAFQHSRAALNDFGSQSGCHALANAILQAGHNPKSPFFSEVIVSGAHSASARMVSDDLADIAAIDAVAWALFEELEPARFAQLRVIEWTKSTPALPFITAPKYTDDIPAILAALQVAAQTSPPAIGLPTQILPTGDSDYDPIRAMTARVKGFQLAPNSPALGL